MPKFFNDVTIGLPRLDEDKWFDLHQDLLLQIANTRFGRDLLCIPQEYPAIFKIKKNCVHWHLPDGRRQADFRVGAKWANVIRFRWEQFNSYARYFQAPRFILSTEDLEKSRLVSPLVRAAMSMTCSTLTAYPDPNVETTTMDGTSAFNNGTWSTVHDAAAGNSTQDSGTDDYIEVFHTASDHYIWRYFHLYDTSSLGSTSVVSAFTVSLYVNTKADSDNDGNDYIVICSSAPASNTALVNADYDQVGTTAFTDTKDITSISTGAYLVFTGVAAGIAAISLTGVTKFGGREGHDMVNDTPSTGTNDETGIYFKMADTSGTTTDPKLIVTYAVPPSTPTGAACVAANASTSLTITWTDNASDEEEYYVERSDDGVGSWSVISGALAANSNSYVDAVGTNSSTKYYRVRCKDTDTGLFSSYSSVVSATTAPAAPTIGAVTATSNANTLTIAWTDNSSDETTFSIEASANGSSGWSEITTDTASTYVHDVGARDTTRYYRIRAYRSGDGIYSGYSSNSTAATTAPADPSGLATANITGGIRLTWTDNSSSESTFSIERKIGSGSFAVLTTDTASPYDDTAGMIEDTTYTYKLRAYRASDGIYSGYTSSVAGAFPVVAPSNLQAVCSVVNSTSSKVRLTWDINTTLETGYLIEKSTDGNSWSTVTTVAAGLAAYEVTGLTAAATYYFRVSSVGNAGNSSPCTAVTVAINRTDGSSLIDAFDKKVRHFPY